MNAAAKIRVELAEKTDADARAALEQLNRYNQQVALEQEKAVIRAVKNLPDLIEQIRQGILDPSYGRLKHSRLRMWEHYELLPLEQIPACYIGDYTYQQEVARLLVAEGFHVQSRSAGNDYAERGEWVEAWLEVRL